MGATKLSNWSAGSGFGASGEGYIRISAFNSRANVDEAMVRLAKKLKS